MAQIDDRGSICICKDGKLYEYNKNGLTPIKKSRAKSYFCGLFISPDDIYSYSLELPSDIEEDRFDTSVEIALFESEKLDLQHSYLIAYKKSLAYSGDIWIVEAFVAQENRVYELYEDIANDIGHIDLIAIPYLAYEAWYIQQFGGKKLGVDLIIRLDNKHSFISLYRNGNFIGYQKIYSLEYMSKKIGISKERLRDILIEQGLNENLYIDRDKNIYYKLYSMFIDIMRQIDRFIKNRVSYFDFNKIDTIILDFDGDKIENFWILLDEYGFYSSKKEIFLFEDGNRCRGGLECIKNLYISFVSQGVITDAPNLTPFGKRPLFISTYIGKLSLSIFISLLIVIILGLYYEYRLDRLNSKNIQLRETLSKLEDKAKDYKNILNSLKRDIKRDGDRLIKIEKDTVEFEKAIKRLVDIRVSTKERQKMIRDINMVMSRYHIMSSSVDINDSKIFTIEVIVPYKKRYEIASLMSDIKTKGYKSVKTDSIILNKDLYRSRIVIKR